MIPVDPEAGTPSVATPDQPDTSKLIVPPVSKLKQWRSKARSKVGGKFPEWRVPWPTLGKVLVPLLAISAAAILAWFGLNAIADTTEEVQRVQFVATVTFVLITYWLVSITRSTLEAARTANQFQSDSFRVLSIYPHIYPTLEKIKSADGGLVQCLTVYNRSNVQAFDVFITVFHFTEDWSAQPGATSPEPHVEYEVIYSDMVAMLPPGYRFRCSFPDPRDLTWMEVLIQHSDILSNNHIEKYTFQKLRPSEGLGDVRLTLVQKQPEKEHPLLDTYYQTGGKLGVRYIGEEVPPSYIAEEMLNAMKESKVSLLGSSAIDRSLAKIEDT